tara:strand:+ start:1400 stop:1849 length:450 start_codon:yes stop_codon:yes gene_type:complete
MSSFNDHQQAMSDAAELLVEKELKHYKQSLEVIKVLAELRANKDPSHQDYADLVHAALDRGVEISQEELDWEYVNKQFNLYQTGNDPYDEEYESEYDKKLKAEKKKEEEINAAYKQHKQLNAQYEIIQKNNERLDKAVKEFKFAAGGGG